VSRLYSKPNQRILDRYMEGNVQKIEGLGTERAGLVGLLSFQGAYAAHGEVVRSLGWKAMEVRTREELQRCSHLILPGGESTTFLKLLEFHDLSGALRAHAESGKPILVTCAGLIVMAKEVLCPPQKSLGIYDVVIERNAYGRQVDSFETELDIPVLGSEKFHGLFIRAPRIKSIGKTVEVLSVYQGDPVFVREGNLFGVTFHPELSGDARLHRLFLEAG
jgi:pyridoxal 5'-phosphate synthase pdxT subunit